MDGPEDLKGLEQQIEKIRERVSRLTERAKSSGLNYRETVAAAVGSAGSYQAFGSQHQALGTDMEELRKRKDRESSRLFVARAADAQRGALSRKFSGMPAADMGDRLAPMLAKQREAIKALGGNLREAETRLAAFQAKAKDSGGASGALALKLARAEEEVGQLSAKLMQSGAAYRETVALATSAGNRIGELASRYRTLSASMEAAKRHQQAVDANMSRRAALRDQRSDLNGRLIGGAAQAATAAIPVKLAVSAEDTFADLKKVMNGADDELLGQVYQDALKMCSETGKSFEDVVAIMTSGAQAGLGKTREEMRSNTEQAIQMSIAWGVTAEQAGDSLATWRSSMGMTSQEARHTADVINALSNEMNGEAGEIDRIFTRMGPLLKGSGMASQDIAALGMAFKASGAEVEVAGTAMKNFTNVLALGNSMTKDQKEIFSRLGLDPKAMQKQMQTDAKGAIMTLLKQIKRVPVERQNEVAMKLFGQESIAAIAPLLENLGLLKQAFEIANSNVDDSVLEEYQNRMKTTATEEATSSRSRRATSASRSATRPCQAYNAFLKTMSKGVGVMQGLPRNIRTSPRHCSAAWARWRPDRWRHRFRLRLQWPCDDDQRRREGRGCWRFAAGDHRQHSGDRGRHHSGAPEPGGASVGRMWGRFRQHGQDLGSGMLSLIGIQRAPPSVCVGDRNEGLGINKAVGKGPRRVEVRVRPGRDRHRGYRACGLLADRKLGCRRPVFRQGVGLDLRKV